VVVPRTSPCQGGGQGYGAQVVLCEPTASARQATVEREAARMERDHLHPQ
jgi:hypothetical protein